MLTRMKTVLLIAAAIPLAALGGCASDTAAPVPPSANACPAWVNSPADSHSNADSAYLGCSNAMNLAHMAEDPKDLKQGRDLGPADGATQAKAVKNYEEDRVKKPESGSATQLLVAPVASGSSGAGSQ